MRPECDVPCGKPDTYTYSSLDDGFSVAFGKDGGSICKTSAWWSIPRGPVISTRSSSDKSSFILKTDIEDNAGCASSFDWLLHRRGHSQQRTQAIQRLTQSNRRIVQINMNISNNITITNGCTSLTICCVMNQMNDMMAGLPNMCTLADEVSQTSQTILGVHPCMTRRR